MTGAGTLVCTDLDQTLVYSRRWAGDVDPAELRCVEVYRGADISFLTVRAAEAVAALGAAAAWVPATTRTIEQYRRVRLPGATAGVESPRYAVCANGGVLLVDDRPDPDWAAHVRDVVGGSAPVRAVEREMARRAAGLPDGAVGAVRDAQGLFRYAVVERALLSPAWLADLTGWCAAQGWRTSVQGRKLYCLPAGLTKAAAAREVARRLGTTTMLAAGDSLLDADLLDAADAGLRPAHGELADAGWHRDHVAVTASTGARAGEEIACRLLAAARAGPAHLLPVVQRSPQP